MSPAAPAPQGRPALGRVSRAIAGVLAVVWIGAGAAAVVLGVGQRRWLAVLLGLVALAYGAVWVGVARTGRYARWPLGRRR